MSYFYNIIDYNNEQYTPSKIVCIGRNFADHIAELGNQVPSMPVIFIKPNSALSDVLKSHDNVDIHYETEISFLLKAGKFIGVGLGFDLTQREVQTQLKSKGLPWERAKAFDGSVLFSKFVTIPDRNKQLHLELWVEGELRQAGGESLMLNKPEDLVTQVQSFMSFADYDVLMTGTPSGVGKIKKGQHFVAKLFADSELLIQQEWIVE